MSLGGYGGTDVSADRNSKVFNTGNWNQPRQVTLTTNEDINIRDETVTITHIATSTDADYSGVTVASLTVTVVDNDTPQVAGVSIQPGYEQLTVNWTAARNATGYKLQWRRPGESYDTHTRLITINLGFNHDLHHPRSHQPHPVRSAGCRNQNGPKRRPMVRRGHGHAGGAMTTRPTERSLPEE